ncbi:ABC transporter substrate-binding protein [Actinomadura luteofluorescens]|uniref:ABC transporter substrate-binding protein n=1 Tax=Actinomadura luteofluorescens TaxID=46163 RepID=UPI002164BE66|nr:ABC transporter substrate-binding protein [Actinomadura glauciflava]MCR3742823.1 peptide/nickel transport system substrate-binding protein [Actinomadura glauciflava]
MTVSERPQAAPWSGGRPRLGGTLRLRGPAPVHRLDPSASHQAPADQIIRLFARQLFGYAPAPDLRDWRAIAPAPDLATDVPSTYNTGMGARHTNYVVHLRRGVLWDTAPAREVTAHDVVRGLKRLANPLTRPAALPYFTSTIRGMAQYCEDYAAAVRRDDPTAEELAAFQNSHDIPGVLVLDDESLVIELMRPAIDFAAIMALPCASPAPVEYDAFLPGSPELHRNLRSNGPYRPVRLVPGRELRLEPNPVWRQDTDPLRHRYLDGVEVTVEEAAPEQVAERIASGAADLPWGGPVAEPHDAEPADPGDGLGLSLDPYLVFNVQSPGAGGALADARVRRALSYAIDKAAIADLYRRSGRGALVRIAGSVVPPGNDAHQELDLYATPGSRGDAQKCRALLAEAGHENGLALTAVHLDTALDAAVARSYAADLEKAGVTVRLVALDHDARDALLGDPRRAAAGEWDVAASSWSPDWYPSNGRVFLQPMFQSGDSRNSANRGRYRRPEVDRLIERALGTIEEPARSTAAWNLAERTVLEDAAVVPVLFQRPVVPRLRGPRVRGAVPMPAFGHSYDLAGVWLDPPDDPAG